MKKILVLIIILSLSYGNFNENKKTKNLCLLYSLSIFSISTATLIIAPTIKNSNLKKTLPIVSKINMLTSGCMFVITLTF